MANGAAPPSPRAAAPSPQRRRAVQLGLSSLSALALAGCGFELRRAPPLAFSTIALTGFAPRSPLAEELRRTLAQRVQVLDNPALAEVVLQATQDLRQKSVVASTAAAQVREFQLRVRLEFRAQTAGGRELMAPATLLLSRDMSYSESAALAKEQEEAEFYREMQTDVVLQVMRRLASIRL